MTDDQLRTAIAADPQAAALAATGNDAGCAARLAALLPAVPARYIPVFTLIYWGALTGIRSKMQAHANNTASPVQSLALAFEDMVASASSPGIDTTDPLIVGMTAAGAYRAGSGAALTAPGMLDAFVSASVFAGSGKGSKDDLLAMAPTTPAPVAADDVSRAMLPGRPNGRIA